MTSRMLIGAAAAFALPVAAASADMVFTATLDGSQEVGPNASTASGTAILTLNDLQNRLTIEITLVGVDLDGNQTVDGGDNVSAMHIHAAPAGVNGGVVFGFIGPNHDLNGDLVIDPVAGTIFSAWDVGEGAQSLASQLTNLSNEGLYINVHTPEFPGGEIRGQITPAPTTLGLLGLAGLGAVRRRR